MRERVYLRLTTVAAVFVVALGAFADRAAAQIPAADGQLYACVRIDRDKDEGRLVRLVAAGEPCRRNEARIHWSVAGPQGKPGINGTNGANGTSGTNGTSVTITGTLLRGDTHCSTGGLSLSDGAGTYYLCNGADGGTGGTRAAGPCLASNHRYVDCGNGTVTDMVTGLIWLKNASCFPDAMWVAANQTVAGLAQGACGLTDGSSAGDWRLPTYGEWSATIARAVALGCVTDRLAANGPSLTNDFGTGCLNAGDGSSFTGVAVAYWSSSTSDVFIGGWYAFLGGGGISNSLKSEVLGVWPVRGGAR